MNPSEKFIVKKEVEGGREERKANRKPAC